MYDSRPSECSLQISTWVVAKEWALRTDWIGIPWVINDYHNLERESGTTDPEEPLYIPKNLKQHCGNVFLSLDMVVDYWTPAIVTTYFKHANQALEPIVFRRDTGIDPDVEFRAHKLCKSQGQRIKCLGGVE